MLELVEQSVAQRGHDVRTGEQDLLAEFGLTPFLAHVMKAQDKNYIAISSKDAPAGLPGDVALYANPAWSLLRRAGEGGAPPPVETQAGSAIEARVRWGLKLAPGGYLLSAEDKGADVTRVFMKNVQAAPAKSAGGAGQAGGGAAGGGERVPPGKRRLVLTNVGGGGGGDRGGDRVSGSEQQASGDTGSHTFSHDSKRQRSYY